jgi:ssDNA thymidine ADP-ribosyltransferase, DarT
VIELEDIKLYRMTHIENVPHILKWGIGHRHTPNANPAFKAIGDVSLIGTRNSKKVRVDNGDSSKTRAPGIILGDFIPFYFGIKMPMLYVIKNGGNFVMKATSAEDIVYLVCSLKRILKLGLPFYFSDGHATDNLTTFYDSTCVADLPTIIDWDAVKAPYWGGGENLNLKRKKQAEFLLAEDLPPNNLLGMACYNAKASRKLESMGFDEKRIKIVPAAYF